MKMDPHAAHADVIETQKNLGAQFSSPEDPHPLLPLTVRA